MKKIHTMLFCGALSLMTGCVHLESVSTTSVPEERNNLIEVETSRFIFMGINTNNDYANELTESLAAKCPQGRVEGVLTKLESIVYFPLFAHSKRIKATAYCVQNEEGAP